MNSECKEDNPLRCSYPHCSCMAKSSDNESTKHNYSLTKLPPVDGESRIETGPIQFGDDWPGVFLRGDSALAAAMHIEAALNVIDDKAAGIKSVLSSHVELLRSCSTAEKK